MSTALNDVKKYCKNEKLPDVFDEVVYELECTKAVAARDTSAVTTCLENMCEKVGESFFQDTPWCK